MEVGIFTDSLSNLMKIKQGMAETPEEKQLFECIAKHPHNLTFHHVSAHKDNRKNIEVDKLCNAATNPSDREIHLYLGGTKTSATIKQWTSEIIREERMKKVIECETAKKRKSKTQAFITNYLSDDGEAMNQRPKACNQLPRKEGVLMAKLRTNNWIQCNYFQHSIEKRDNALCTTCDVLDDVEHVMNKCRIHTDNRQIMLLRLQHPGKVTELIAREEQNIVRELAKFLVEVSDRRKEITKRTKGRPNSKVSDDPVSGSATPKVKQQPANINKTQTNRRPQRQQQQKLSSMAPGLGATH